MAFKLRSGNKVNFKEIGSSPFRAEGEGDDSNSAGNFDWANTTVSGADGPEFDPTSQSKSELGSLVDESRSQADIDKEQAEKDKNAATQTGGVTNEASEIKEKGLDTELPPELKWHEKAAWQDSGAGHIAEAFKSIRKGLKNRKAKKSDEKTQNIADAKEAVGSGTENLKQAKLVEKNRKKVDRKAKRKIKSDAKDKKKLAEYRKKNPVRGREAIKLVTGGGDKSLE